MPVRTNLKRKYAALNEAAELEFEEAMEGFGALFRQPALSSHRAQVSWAKDDLQYKDMQYRPPLGLGTLVFGNDKNDRLEVWMEENRFGISGTEKNCGGPEGRYFIRFQRNPGLPTWIETFSDPRDLLNKARKLSTKLELFRKENSVKKSLEEPARNLELVAGASPNPAALTL